MKKIKARSVEKPVREEPEITATVEEIVAAVNAGLNPGGPVCNWFEGAPDAVAAVTIRDGEAQVTNPDVIHGGRVDGQLISDLKVVAYRTPEGGVYAEGPATNAVLELVSTTLRGAVVNANLDMDGGSKWFATGDSFVTLIEDVRVGQIDAPEGVTIHAAGGEDGEYDLLSGGKLIVRK